MKLLHTLPRGFLSLFFAVALLTASADTRATVQDAPELQVLKMPDGKTVLHYDVRAEGWLLEQSHKPDGPFVPVGEGERIEPGWRYTTLRADNEHKYFRLRWPDNSVPPTEAYYRYSKYQPVISDLPELLFENLLDGRRTAYFDKRAVGFVLQCADESGAWRNVGDSASSDPSAGERLGKEGGSYVTIQKSNTAKYFRLVWPDKASPLVSRVFLGYEGAKQFPTIKLALDREGNYRVYYDRLAEGYVLQKAFEIDSSPAWSNFLEGTPIPEGQGNTEVPPPSKDKPQRFFQLVWPEAQWYHG